MQIYYDIMNDIYELVTAFKLIIISNAVSLSNRILVYVDQRHINYDKTKIYDMIHNILIINVQCVKMNQFAILENIYRISNIICISPSS